MSEPAAERVLLQRQIEALQAQLANLTDWIDARAATGPVASTDADTFTDALWRRAAPGFRKQIQDQRGVLEKVAAQMENGKRPASLSWARFGDARADCQNLFREFLAFVQGSLARSSQVDGGLCTVADALLDDIAERAGLPWRGFTILAEGEFLYDMANIIRLRFPETSVWSLPVAAHEFGHYVAGALVGRQGGAPHFPFLDLLEREAKEDAILQRHLHEYFADLFAIYTLGPAYAYTCVWLRLNPARGDSATHPGAAKRVHFMLRALELIGEEAEGSSPYTAMLGPLRAAWRKSLTAVGQQEALDAATQGQLETWLAQMLIILQRGLLDEVRYDGWLRAKTFSTYLLTAPAAETQATDKGLSMADVLNAGWFLRLGRWQDSDDISERVMALCCGLVQSRRAQAAAGLGV